MIHIEDIMKNLSEKRPVFHSEADFQHALAWEIHETHPDFGIRLEGRIDIEKESFYVDMVVLKDGKMRYFIELKYKTVVINPKNKDEIYTIHGESFSLKNQGARDVARYDFCKDIRRLEKIVEKKPESRGYAIFLTNDHLYWKHGRRNTNDEKFKIHKDAVLNGTLRWGPNTGIGTMKGRENEINLKNAYNIIWREYSDIEESKFRYTFVEV